MHKITNLPTGVVGTADTNPHNEKSAYKAPKVTTVQFKVESGFDSITGQNGYTTSETTAWQPNNGDGAQTYFGDRSF